MHDTYIGIDNGSTGTIGIISNDQVVFVKTPRVMVQDYHKKKKNIGRIDAPELIKLLRPFAKLKPVALVEHPMVNQTRFTQSLSAVRAFEATLIVLEGFGIANITIPSSDWQKSMLPKGCKGDDLKKASRDIGIKLFPQFKELITKHKDADGILIAEWARRLNL